jgi:transposase-like protein
MRVEDIATAWGCTPQTVYNVARRGRLSLPQRRRYPKHIERAPTYPALHRPGWLGEQLGTGRTLASIAQEIGCSIGAVRAAIRKAGITERRAHGELRFPQLHDRAWLREQYLRDGKSVAAIARMLGASESATNRATHAARIGLRPQRTERPPASRLRTDWRLFPTISTTARLHDVSDALAQVWLAEVGIFTRPPVIPTGALLAYATTGLTERGIAAQLGVDQRVVRLELARLGAALAASRG